MPNIRATLSQCDVLVHCTSLEEASKLHRAVQTVPVDTLDDVVSAWPAVQLELKALQEGRVKLLEQVAKLEAKLKKPKEVVLGGKKRKK